MRHPNPTVRWISYVVTAAVLFLLFVLLRNSTWEGQEALRTIYLVIAPTIAFFAGTVALVRYYARRSNAYLMVGTGFLSAAALISYQAIMSKSDLGLQLWGAVPDTLPPWCWFSARLLLSLSLFMSWWTWRREQLLGEKGLIRRAWLVYLIAGVVTTTAAAIATLGVLPPVDRAVAYLPHRPHELIPAFFYGVALIGYLTKKQWRTDPFDHWLILFLIIAVVNQIIFLPISQNPSDPRANLARLLAALSYLCVLMGLLSSMYQLFVHAERSAEALASTNVSLQKQIEERQRVELELRELTGTLEERVGQRTQELEVLRRAAVDMAEEAEESRRGAEEAAEALQQSEEDLRQAHSALERKYEEMEEFLSIIAHDLKHPVVGVQGLLSLIKEDCYEKIAPDSRQNLDMCLGECERMKEMLAHLSHLGRIEGVKPKRMQVKLDTVINACIERFRPQIQKKQAAVQLEAPPVEVIIARSHVEEALTNLIDNALKYGCEKEGAPLSVGCRVVDGWCEMWVSDQGPGIDPRYHQRIFQPFRRLKSPNGISGTGMGLTAVRRLMQRIGGTVLVESQLAQGARFIIRFPLDYEVP